MTPKYLRLLQDIPPAYKGQALHGAIAGKRAIVVLPDGRERCIPRDAVEPIPLKHGVIGQVLTPQQSSRDILTAPVWVQRAVLAPVEDRAAFPFAAVSVLALFVALVWRWV